MIVVDTNVIRRLVKPADLRRARESTRAAGLMIVPSMVNVLEIACHPNAYLRNRLFAVVKELDEESMLLPEPLQVLHEIGLGLVKNEKPLTIPMLRFRAEVMGDGVVADDLLRQLRVKQRERRERWTRAYDDIRMSLQAHFRRENLADEWKSVEAFLDDESAAGQIVLKAMGHQWKNLELPGDFPVAPVAANETWRLHFDGFGANYYEQCIAKQRAAVAHPNDVDQLLYLSIVQPRILVTGDKDLVRVATSVLRGRYTNARAIYRDAFFADVV